MQLLVDIHKQLASYPLEVKFNLEGRVLGILGGSGSGKSMTLRCIAGLETPKRGRIVLNGRVLFDSSKRINLPIRLRRVGIVFQNYALFPHLTVAQNITYGLQDLSSAERQHRLHEQIAKLQLFGLENRYPQQLSGGQQQRVALARALAVEPEILLLDEPFSALDTHLRHHLQEQMIETLSSYQGVTLFVTHNLEEAYEICEQLLVMSQGQAIAYDQKQAIFERPATYTVAQLTGCKNFSKTRAISPTQVEAIDWGCTLNVIEPIPESFAYVGIRAHHLTFTNDPNTENTFSCWLAHTRETPHRMTLYLKLHNPPTQSNDYHMQAEVFKEKWATIKDRPFPWYVKLDSLRLFLMQA
ncbi:sulfate/molybdate ABC transporter ATP-binding protein [Fischerella thermalis]|uniref:sulfate/molybdate ABC transporter ATP-binding protein n=1 Tax=Fischerella thermalis TaxID=372787 RepID=UPI000C80D733|nr:ABC transporter [Fischerella thermalis WC114]PLZ15225.1 ABC transporter [Fischerella thermalis WC119]PLZ25133.1 ABC transporter [Fischerella thermalis WC157]PLZ63902.1 ABC transporter [Fischerella thermalis WC249]PLZ66234.1 ABC transporter [Fischerella thermalis WC246]PLZ78838.1 ABC transporter [Fischerella thermalis WC245]PMB05700.1 ABC transporter [Fischerella thermalis CCMEE 5328]